MKLSMAILPSLTILSKQVHTITDDFFIVLVVVELEKEMVVA